MSMSWQVHIFLMSFLFGVLSGFTYDLIRIFRRIFKHKNIFIQIEDGIYWLIISISFLFFLFYETYGEIRGFLILGMFCGMIVYYLGISPYVIKFSLKIIKFLIDAVLMPLRIIYKLFYKLFEKPINFLKSRFKIFSINLKKHLKNCVKYVRIRNRKKTRK